MISGAPITPQNSLGAAQNDPATTGSGSWLGRTIKVLKGVTCFVSGVAAVAALATGFYVVAAVCGAIFAVSGLSLLFGKSHNKVEPSGASPQSPSDDPDDSGAVELCSTDQSEPVSQVELCSTGQSEPVSQVATHNTHIPADPLTNPVYRGSSVPLQPVNPPTVNVSTNNGEGLMSTTELLRCDSELHDVVRNVRFVLEAMRMNSLTGLSGSDYGQRIVDLRANEPFDEKLFLLLAKNLKVEKSVIDSHQQTDKAVKIELLEKLVEQQEEGLQAQLQHANNHMVNLENLEKDLERYSLVRRINSIPDPVPENEVAQMNRHLDALDTLLADIRKCSPPGCFIDSDGFLQRRLSELEAVISKCRNILNGTDRKY
ncbi:hypothetical protein [Endozoicomonas sp. GU-1]|uniref:hypothetical protein n=1 Tax=Endozoicomonas sp. GU-1 TaxID=3009078 RepID=UPI0022B4E323|nr:hypothetical protein [Endozoicomonas sp. GU-1]WBA84167.1 hypothetical protein O3276_12655 [Endozoicomonas sp. GU-1]